MSAVRYDVVLGMERRRVAALCVSGRSVYKHLPGVDAYDQQRDARTFAGGVPVVAHPPCRCWSKYLRHQAKPVDREAEMALGVWCVDQVLRHGGVLEQPAHSKLWERCGLPVPGDWHDPFLYSLYVEQQWFGFGSRKPTWVLVSGVPPRHLFDHAMPFRLESPALVNVCKLGKEQASRTMGSFAEWLVGVARETWFSHGRAELAWGPFPPVSGQRRGSEKSLISNPSASSFVETCRGAGFGTSAARAGFAAMREAAAGGMAHGGRLGTERCSAAEPLGLSNYQQVR